MAKAKAEYHDRGARPDLLQNCYMQMDTGIQRDTKDTVRYRRNTG